MAPKDKDLITKKVWCYTGSGVAGWIGMMSKLVNPQEHLEQGSRNINRPHHLFMTIITPQVIQQSLIMLV